MDQGTLCNEITTRLTNLTIIKYTPAEQILTAFNKVKNSGAINSTIYLNEYFSQPAADQPYFLRGIRFPCAAASSNLLMRLFVGDLLWLFYFDRMGIFKILGAILDDFATTGKYPIDSSTDAAGTLENLIELTKQGLSSTMRDRDTSYRRCLGWTSDTGKKSEINASTNTGFNLYFHKLIQNCLDYYKDKRLAVAIQASANPGQPSAATLTTISESMNALKQTLQAFGEGRNHTNTATGIAWVIISMYLICAVKESLGIPASYKEPYQYLSAAFALLVEGKSATLSDTNRYNAHKQCAENGRDILLSLEVLDSSKTGKDDELETWLTLMETRVEAYRTAYRSLTGVDLGVPGAPRIEQQA